MTYVTLKFSWCFCTNHKDVIKADTNYLVPVSNFWDHYWLGGRYMFLETFFFHKNASGSMSGWISILSMPIFNCGSKCSSTVQSVQIFLIITQRTKSSYLSEIKVTSLEKKTIISCIAIDIPLISLVSRYGLNLINCVLLKFGVISPL